MLKVLKPTGFKYSIFREHWGNINVHAGLDFRKKPWGQLAPKFLDLVAKKIFGPLGRKLLLENVNTAFSLAQRKSTGKLRWKAICKKNLNVALL